MSVGQATIEEPYPASDDRWRALLYGVGQLSRPELLRLRRTLDTAGEVVLDSFNYDPARRRWCPLAVALGVPDIAAEHWPHHQLSNRSAKDLIIAIGRERHGGAFSLNPLQGIEGRCFRTSRRSDLVAAVDTVLATADR